MRITRARLFKKTLPYGKRNYFILLFRYLLNQSSLLLFLSYDGDSSSKLNELRILAANYQVTVHLLLRRWVSSIFSTSLPKVASLQCRLLLLSSDKEENLLRLSQKPQFSSLLEQFPFLALGYQGLLSQEPFFSLLLLPKGLPLLQLIELQKRRLPLLWIFPLLPLQRVLHLLHIHQSKNSLL